MVKSKSKILAIVLSVTVISIGVIVTMQLPMVATYARCVNHTGNHYAFKDATTTNPGHKEFWTCCACHEHFLTKPQGYFVDVDDKFMIGDITNDDDRYIKPYEGKAVYNYDTSTNHLELKFLENSQLDKETYTGEIPTQITSETFQSYKRKCTHVTFDESMKKWDAVTSTSSMFSGLEYVSSIEGLANFNTSNVTDMSYMFYSIGSRVSDEMTIDLSGLDTSKVTDMSYMFQGGSSTTGGIKNIILNGLDTSKVTNMEYIFYRLKTKYLNLSSFNTSSVTKAENMFANMKSLKAIFVLDSFTNQVILSQQYMFSNLTNSSLAGYCYDKIGESLSSFPWTSDKISGQYAKICTGENKGGFFSDATYKTEIMAILESLPS